MHSSHDLKLFRQQAAARASMSELPAPNDENGTHSPAADEQAGKKRARAEEHATVAGAPMAEVETEVAAANGSKGRNAKRKRIAASDSPADKTHQSKHRANGVAAKQRRSETPFDEADAESDVPTRPTLRSSPRSSSGTQGTTSTRLPRSLQRSRRAG